jgi:ribonuclease III
MFKKFIKSLLSPEEKLNIQRDLERKLGHKFKNRDLLLTALVHRSLVHGVYNEPVENNERLEFLGDSILNFIVTDYLYCNFPNKSEGDLAKMKSVIVSTGVLADCARSLELGLYIQLGPSEERSGGRDRTSLLADLYEALLGAIYLDKGVKPCEKLIHKTLIPHIDTYLGARENRNFKSELLELCQSKQKGQPIYEVLNETGPEHEKMFKVTVLIENKKIAIGVGRSKKVAQQDAARNALDHFLKSTVQHE